MAAVLACRARGGAALPVRRAAVQPCGHPAGQLRSWPRPTQLLPCCRSARPRRPPPNQPSNRAAPTATARQAPAGSKHTRRRPLLSLPHCPHQRLPLRPALQRGDGGGAAARHDGGRVARHCAGPAAQGGRVGVRVGAGFRWRARRARVGEAHDSAGPAAQAGWMVMPAAAVAAAAAASEDATAVAATAAAAGDARNCRCRSATRVPLQLEALEQGCNLKPATLCNTNLLPCLVLRLLRCKCSWRRWSRWSAPLCTSTTSGGASPSTRCGPLRWDDTGGLLGCLLARCCGQRWGSPRPAQHGMHGRQACHAWRAGPACHAWRAGQQQRPRPPPVLLSAASQTEAA